MQEHNFNYSLLLFPTLYRMIKEHATFFHWTQVRKNNNYFIERGGLVVRYILSTIYPMSLFILIKCINEGY